MADEEDRCVMGQVWGGADGPEVQSTLSLPELASREGAGPGVSSQGRMARRGSLATGVGRGVESHAQPVQPEGHKHLALSTL